MSETVLLTTTTSERPSRLRSATAIAASPGLIATPPYQVNPMLALAGDALRRTPASSNARERGGATKQDMRSSLWIESAKTESPPGTQGSSNWTRRAPSLCALVVTALAWLHAWQSPTGCGRRSGRMIDPLERDLFRRIQDRMAIVGIGHLPFAKDIGRPIGDTAVEAIQLALDDAGLAGRGRRRHVHVRDGAHPRGLHRAPARREEPALVGQDLLRRRRLVRDDHARLRRHRQRARRRSWSATAPATAAPRPRGRGRRRRAA